MMALSFEKPHVGLQDSYRGMLAEFRSRDEPLIPYVLSLPNDDFAGEEVVGVSHLRHRLTEPLRVEGGNIGYGIRPSARRRGYATELLRRTLGEARAVGLSEALLTCSKANTASARTILRCGGRLHSEEFIPARGEIVQRYVIAL